MMVKDMKNKQQKRKEREIIMNRMGLGVGGRGGCKHITRLKPKMSENMVNR